MLTRQDAILGVDVSSACRQLLSTLEQFQSELKEWDYEYLCRAVVAGMPAPNNYSASYRKLMKALKQKKDGIIFKCRRLEEYI